ncbi:VPS9D1 isoform 2 [Pan troglodytes]|uniref:VPS9 domain containing 1 n=8 Tax=Catarrhini TaxID=9526 RepID=H3BNK1_HUMAN|nr:VPS9 domain containing 1 [Homo sapiens]KAI4056640.1 VPS9 domain containing 1 [Homo sapiens]PNI16172.1 VPS9D1 isoform 2 [Pan troglodytes]PNJ12403.1 VPS9D1 isoform 2 [Pongo abelii]
MAAAAGDGTVKPLQSAMKLANGAIELDTGNRPRRADATGGGLPAESEAEGCV